MLWLLALWNVIIRDSSGHVVLNEKVDDSRQLIVLLETYLSKGYFVTILEDSDEGPRLNSFVEGSRNIVSSISPGPGIEVNASDPANPVVSVKKSCNADQILVWNGSDWICQDKPSASSEGDYTQVSLLSNLKNAYWQDAFYICDTLTEGGYTNWRLPTLAELTRLCMVYYRNGDNRCVGKELFTSEANLVNSSAAVPLVLTWSSYYNRFYPGGADDYADTPYDFFCVR